MKHTKIAYNFLPSESDNTVIEIFDAIANKKSPNYATGGENNEVTPSDFQEKLNTITTKNITIRMNSAGGEVTAANVISVAIQEARNNGKHFTCKIVGVCASAAVQIAMSCDEVIIHESALMMIHNPKAGLYGYYDSLALKPIENMLSAVKESILNYYTKKTEMGRQKLSNLMDEEFYMDGKKAVELGFADSLMFEEEPEDKVIDRIQTVVNCCDFHHVPEKYRSVAINSINNTKGENEMQEIKNIADLTNSFPDLVNQIKADAVAEARNSAIEEGVQQERARIQAIDEMADKVSPELLNRAKYETFDTAEKVAVEAIKTGAFNNATVLNNMAQDSVDTNNVAGAVNDGSPAPAVDPKKEATAHAEQVAKNHFESIGKGGKA